MRRSLFCMALATLLALLGGGTAFGQAGTAPATWSASDCQTCHAAAVGPTYERSKHAAADQSCANCHQNVGEHVAAKMAGESGPPAPSLKQLKARELERRLPGMPRDRQSGQLARRECTIGATWRAPRATACTPAKSAIAQLKTVRDSETCYACHKSGAREVDAHLAPPGARREDGLLELPQSARRLAPEDAAGRVGERALLQVPRREARAVPLRARAGPRGLRVVPRAARLEPQPAARLRSCRISAGTAT